MAQSKEGYEPISWRFASEKDIQRIERRAIREGGQVLIPGDTPAAAGLSDFPNDIPNVTPNPTLVNAATKLQALISDRTDFVVLTPGSRERFTLLNALNAADINAGPLGL
jgi:hypothetical protein